MKVLPMTDDIALTYRGFELAQKQAYRNILFNKNPNMPTLRRVVNDPLQRIQKRHIVMLRFILQTGVLKTEKSSAGILVFEPDTDLSLFLRKNCLNSHSNDLLCDISEYVTSHNLISDADYKRLYAKGVHNQYLSGSETCL